VRNFGRCFPGWQKKVVAIGAGEPGLSKDNFVNGIKRMAVSVTAK